MFPLLHDFFSKKIDAYSHFLTPGVTMAQFGLIKELVTMPLNLKPEFTIVIFIHYKPRIAIAILDL